MPRLRLIFFGTAELACPSLAALADHPDYEMVGVVTQPDRPKGRELKLHPSAVKAVALGRHLPVLQPERVKHPLSLAALAQLHPDLCVVAAYGQILPASILELPPYGCLNVHASLLPKYRGAAPIQWAILEGERQTGVTIMKMDAGLDTGDILTQQSMAIEVLDDAQSLHDKLARVGADLLLRSLPDYLAGRLIPRKQVDQEATYARKITKQDGLLDWNQPARTLLNRIRALTPWPGSFTFLPAAPHQPLLKVWAAAIESHRSGVPGEVLQADRGGILVACGDQALRLLTVQREGSRRMTSEQFLSGCPLLPGQLLRSVPS